MKTTQATRNNLIKKTDKTICQDLAHQFGVDWQKPVTILAGFGNFTAKKILDQTNGDPAIVLFVNCAKWWNWSASRPISIYIDANGAICLQDWRGQGVESPFTKATAHEMRTCANAEYFIIAQPGTTSGEVWRNPTPWADVDKNTRYKVEQVNTYRTQAGAEYIGSLVAVRANGGNACQYVQLVPPSGVWRRTYNNKYTMVEQLIDKSGYPLAVWREALQSRLSKFKADRNKREAIKAGANTAQEFADLVATAATLPRLIAKHLAGAPLAEFMDWSDARAYAWHIDKLHDIAHAIQRHGTKVEQQGYNSATDLRKALDDIKNDIAKLMANVND